MPEERFRLETPRGEVSSVWSSPPGTYAAVVVAHGAGNDMHTPLLEGFCACLNESTFGTLRFNFPYAEQGRRAPDPPATLLETYRAAVAAAQERAGPGHLFLGGKSMGGRIASMLVAEGVRAQGLIFLGYPLHPPGKPERVRDEHLPRVRAPMLFLQGTADPFARWDLVQDLVKRLGRWATLHPVEGGDHSFRVRGQPRDDERTGRLLGSVAAQFIQGAQL
jgi:predicted alpha/beta-hydrolase family hydrolase